MTRHILWNRRTFLQRLGYLSGFGVVGSQTAWSFSKGRTLAQNVYPIRGKTEPSLAYVGSWDHGIQVFAVEGRRWRLTQTIASNKPSALTLHPTQRFLYAVNEIHEYQHLPTSTVEAYGVDAYDGQLTLLNRQPLSLSAVAPRYLAASPDGSSLIVAVHGGGSYNVLPIRTDGSLESVSGIMKEVGSGPDQERQNAAHPQMLLFDTTQRHLLSADLGSDRLNVFTLAEDRLIAVHRSTTVPGSGPRSLALHPSGRLLYVMNELNASISCFGYDATNGQILDRLQHQPLQTVTSSKNADATTMAMHSSGNFLYTSYSHSASGSSVNSRIMAWRINAATGKLNLIQELDKWTKSSYVESMIPSHDALFVLSKAEGIFRLNLDPISGFLSHAVPVAKVSAPKSMVLQYL